MSSADKKNIPAIEAWQVAAYLRDNPDFFEQCPDVLEQLSLPHRAGEAVSLVERQQTLLRERNRDLQGRLDALLGTSHTNDSLFSKSRTLVLQLIAAKTVEDILSCLQKSFTEQFKVEHYSLILLDTKTTAANVRTLTSEEANPSLMSLLHSTEAVCGAFRPHHLQLLFGSEGKKVNSAVAIRLAKDRPYGILALGNSDSHYYHSGMDTLFLGFIADVLTLTLYPMLKE